MKRLFNILILAVAFTLSACTEYEPEGWHGTIFEATSDDVVFDTSYIDYAFGPEKGTTVEIPVSRGVATEAFTTRIKILDAEGNSILSDSDYSMMTIEQAKFEEGQYSAVAKLTFDRRQFVAGTPVDFYLQLNDTKIDSDVTLCALTILRDYTWSEYCGATLESGFWAGMMGYEEVPCVVYKAEGFPFYRVYNSLTGTMDVAVQFIDGVLCPMGTPDSYGDVEFETGVNYAAGAPIVRYVNIDPEYAFFVPDANAIVSMSYYYVPAAGGGFGYLQDVWYCDKPIVTE